MLKIIRFEVEDRNKYHLSRARLDFNMDKREVVPHEEISYVTIRRGPRRGASPRASSPDSGSDLDIGAMVAEQLKHKPNNENMEAFQVICRRMRAKFKKEYEDNEKEKKEIEKKKKESEKMKKSLALMAELNTLEEKCAPFLEETGKKLKQIREDIKKLEERGARQPELRRKYPTVVNKFQRFSRSCGM